MTLSVEESAQGVEEAKRLLSLEPAARTEALYARGQREEYPCGVAAACMLLDRTSLDKADYAPALARWSARQAVREILEVSQLPGYQQERDMVERLGLDGRVKVENP
jgi:hypothetical protein